MGATWRTRSNNDQSRKQKGGSKACKRKIDTTKRRGREKKRDRPREQGKTKTYTRKDKTTEHGGKIKHNAEQRGNQKDQA